MAMVEQFSLGLDLAHRISGPVFDGRGGVQEMFDDSAYSAAPAQSSAGTFQIGDRAPVVAATLALLQVMENGVAEHFPFERAMKAFVFSQRLRRVGPGMRHTNTQGHPPHRQGRDTRVGSVPPRRAIVHEQRAGRP